MGRRLPLQITPSSSARNTSTFHLSNKEIEELEDCESVTPGDFGALSSRIRFMNQDDVNSAYILDELKKLQVEKKKQWKDEGYTEILNTKWDSIWNKVKLVRLSKRPHMSEEEGKIK